MAERRMFAKTIIDSDAFLDMPLTAQALYFHLSMRADDDGLINNPRKIQRMIGASEDDARLLAAKQFIIPFDSGIIAIRHWKIHNHIKNDRYKPSVCAEEKAQLTVTSNGIYETEPVRLPAVSSVEPACIQSGSSPDTQDRLGKDRLGKDRSGKDSPVKAMPAAASLEQSAAPREKAASHPPSRFLVYGTYQNVTLTEEELLQLKQEFPLDYQSRIDRLSSYMASSGRKYHSHFATIRSWAQEDANKAAVPAAASAPLPDWMKVV